MRALVETTKKILSNDKNSKPLLLSIIDSCKRLNKLANHYNKKNKNSQGQDLTLILKS